MNIGWRNGLRYGLLACLALASAPGWATVTGGSAQPAFTAIPLAQPTTITVTWVVTSSPAPAPTYTVSSLFGHFLAPGKTATPLATVNTAVSTVATAVIGATSIGTAIITETVAVPAEVSVQAARLGATTIVYQRTFSDGSTGTAAINAGIIIGGSGLARFGVSRMALAFDDGAVVRVVPLNSRLSAAADVTYVGSGSLRGYWEVADPGSTAGTPIFRQLQSVSQGVGGGDRAKLRSPDLPTDTAGLHIVRLRLTDPSPAFDPPVLYYYVGEPRPGTPFSLMPMTVMNPPNEAYIDASTQFIWQPVRGARVYKIEIFASPEVPSLHLPELGGAPATEDPQLMRRALSRPPIAGMLVAAKQNQTTLSAATRAKLQQRRSYFWRIQAISEDGSVIGEAQVRELRVP